VLLLISHHYLRAPQQESKTRKTTTHIHSASRSNIGCLLQKSYPSSDHFLSTMSMRQLETPPVSSRRSPESGTSTLVEFGSATTVPNNDICCLAYYLKCCVLGCGCENSNAPAELMDYKNAHRLPSHLQQMIYHLALSDLHPHTLMNRMFFIDDSNKLLKPDTMNAFFEWSAISRILAQLEGSAFVEGSRNGLVFRKVMVCTSTWLNEYCILPLYRHISERLGSMVISLSSTSAAAGEYESELLNRSISLHCWHCVGSSDRSCTCRHCCAPIAKTECHVLHDHVVCDGCRRCTDIIGPRYRCAVCPNLDLCKTCYNNSTIHDQTHAFEVIARLGVRPQPLRPRVQLVDECSSIFFLKEQGEDIPVAIAIPILERPPPQEEAEDYR
jgi:hypothetical protein